MRICRLLRRGDWLRVSGSKLFFVSEHLRKHSYCEQVPFSCLISVCRQTYCVGVKILVGGKIQRPYQVLESVDAMCSIGRKTSISLEEKRTCGEQTVLKTKTKQKK